MLEPRLCRWLLTTHDRVGQDDLPLTHDILAEILGAHRTTVTLAAGNLQRSGLLAYRRGRLRILDRPGLERVSCECYAAVRTHFDRGIGGLQAVAAALTTTD